MEVREDLEFEFKQDKLQLEREATRKQQKTLWLYKILSKDESKADQRHGPFEQGKLIQWRAQGFFKETEAIKCVFAKESEPEKWLSESETGF